MTNPQAEATPSQANTELDQENRTRDSSSQHWLFTIKSACVFAQRSSLKFKQIGANLKEQEKSHCIPKVCRSGDAAEMPIGRERGGNTVFLRNLLIFPIDDLSQSKGARRRGELKFFP